VSDVLRGCYKKTAAVEFRPIAIADATMRLIIQRATEGDESVVNFLAVCIDSEIRYFVLLLAQLIIAKPHRSNALPTPSQSDILEKIN